MAKLLDCCNLGLDVSWMDYCYGHWEVILTPAPIDKEAEIMPVMCHNYMAIIALFKPLYLALFLAFSTSSCPLMFLYALP